MYREINIGAKIVPMLANGATPIRFRMVFGKDIMSEFNKVDDDMENTTGCISELAFIMAKAAEAKNGGKPLSNLNQESFIEWLEQFEALDVTMAADEIVELYLGNEKTLSEDKKKVEDAAKEN